MSPVRCRRPVAALVAAVLLLTACAAQPSPSGPPGATATASPTPTPEPTASPSPTPDPEVSFPAAVVTGYTNLKAEITLDEVTEMAADGTLVVPCGFTEYLGQTIVGGGDCLQPDEVIAQIEAKPETIALLPPGLVEPKTKVLPVDGADLFGEPSARQKAYPVQAKGIGLAKEETAYDINDIRSIISLGDSCPDRGVAFQAITKGKGWGWVMGGGTAKYQRVYPNPVPRGVVGNGYNIVDAVPTGNEGAVADLVSGADLTVDDFECPVVDNWRVNDGVVFSIDPAAVKALRDILGVDVATLAANHLTDQGIAGLLSTVDNFDVNDIKHVGAGSSLDEALQPAFLDVNGMSFAFVGFNDVPGVVTAGAGQPGVAPLTAANATEAVKRARDGGADVIFCMPQWWGPGEYFGNFSKLQLQQRAFLFDAGCDHILGAGSHWAGPMAFARDDTGELHFTMASHGNFLFGQSWSQQTQEGVIVELAFRGTTLVQARMHPYIMLLQAQASLIDPETDGHYVLQRVFDNSELDY